MFTLQRSCIALLLFIHGTVKAQKSMPLSKPNIIIIYADDLGYGDLACYGAPNIETPNIDRLAAEGIRFTNYLSASNVCSPSRGALLTGRYPQRNGLPVCPNENAKMDVWNEHVGLPLSEITLPELLNPKGYATAAFGKWHLGKLESFGPRKQGFEEYVGSLYNFPVGKKNVWYHNEEPQGEIRFQEAHEKLTDATIDFMKRQQAKNKPFFVYLSHYLVHGPWSPNKEFCTPEEWASVEQRKGKMNPLALPAMLRELDHHVGLVLSAIKELDIEKETLVIFASDNGPWLPAGSAKPLSEGKYSTKEGGHRVPAIMRWPGHIPAGQVSDEMVTSMDILPTIAAVTDIQLPRGRKYDGYNLLPLLSGDEKKSPRNEFVYYNGLTLEAIRQGDWKLHLPRDPGVPNSNVYWAVRRNKEIKIAILNNLNDDIAEEVTLENVRKTKELEAVAEKTRIELGDWDRDGTDRPKSTYPGNLNTIKLPNNNNNNNNNQEKK